MWVRIGGAVEQGLLTAGAASTIKWKDMTGLVEEADVPNRILGQAAWVAVVGEYSSIGDSRPSD